MIRWGFNPRFQLCGRGYNPLPNKGGNLPNEWGADEDPPS